MVEHVHSLKKGKIIMKKFLLALCFISAIAISPLAYAEEQSINDGGAILTEEPVLVKDVLVDAGMIEEDPSLAGQKAVRVAYNDVYRLYNVSKGSHFYTTNKAEKDLLVSQGIRYEGVAWYAPVGKGVPVFRLYNANASEHFYTTNAAERDMLVAKGWRAEGVAFNAATYPAPYAGRPVYRMFNPNAGPYKSSHVYTVNKNEHDFLIGQGWRFERIAFFVG